MKTEKLAHWAEIISSLVVVVTLIFLIHEVQRNTTALERQSEMDRTAAMTAPFFEGPESASVLAKIKAVDGHDPLPEAFMERYDLSPSEAILWERHLYALWAGLEADFDALGPGEVEGLLRTLVAATDNQLYWEVHGPISGSEFRVFVDSLAAEVEAGS